jgi:hypothetical protein
MSANTNDNTNSKVAPEYKVKVKTYPKKDVNRYGHQIGKVVTTVKNKFTFKPSDMVDYDFKEFMDYIKWDTKEPFEKKRTNDTRTKKSFLPNTEELLSFHPVNMKQTNQNGAGKRKTKMTKKKKRKGSRTKKNRSKK